MKNLLFVLFMLVLVQLSYAQKRRLSFSELMSEIRQGKDTIYKLDNAEIYTEEDRNGRFGLNQNPNNRGGGRLAPPNNDTIIINKHLIFDKVTFLNRGVFFPQIIFKKSISFNACDGRQFTFLNCIFEDNARFDEYERLDIAKCLFRKGAMFNGKERTTISNCTFGIEKDSSKTKVRHSISFSSATADHAVIILDTKFNYSGENSEVSFFLKFSEINLRYCHFKSSVIFRYIFVSDKFSIKNNEFDKNVVFATVKIPIENSAITWSNLKGKIAVLKDTTTENRGRALREAIYTAKDNSELLDENNYDEFISVYSKFLQLYKFRSNSYWYNECYVEMRDIMTRKSALQYQIKPNMRNYLDWKIKVFLKDFSDYGTDYTKSIIYAMEVIFWFALVYFLFPSDTDNLSRKRFFAFFRKSTEYFKTDASLIEIYRTQKEKEIKDLKEFRAMLISSQNSIPKSISFITKPAYQINLMTNSISLWVLKNIDLVGGKWENLSPKRKLWLSIWVALFFTGYVFFGVFMRALNAFALSLNSLTTLGYGGIAARGISRYLVVIEGLIGWFLLTIFSVSLIGQVL